MAPYVGQNYVALLERFRSQRDFTISLGAIFDAGCGVVDLDGECRCPNCVLAMAEANLDEGDEAFACELLTELITDIMPRHMSFPEGHRLHMNV